MTTRLAFIVIAAFVAGAIAALVFVVERGESGAPMIVEQEGEPAIGGPFSLVNHLGETVTEANLQGRYTLMMFGFTNCPDICPAELQVVMSAMEMLGPDAGKVTPIFVTLDPERDTVKTMAAYVSHFGEELVGLTGSPEQIADAAKAYRVYYQKAPDEDGDGYSIDHSAIAYFMGPNGQYLTHFAYGTDAEDLAQGMKRFIASRQANAGFK